jgi:hypothetical protein
MASTIRPFVDDCVMYRKLKKKSRHGNIAERFGQAGGVGG